MKKVLFALLAVGFFAAIAKAEVPFKCYNSSSPSVDFCALAYPVDIYYIVVTATGGSTATLRFLDGSASGGTTFSSCGILTTSTTQVLDSKTTPIRVTKLSILGSRGDTTVNACIWYKLSPGK